MKLLKGNEMGKSVFDVDKEKKLLYNTIKNTYDMFPVGTRVRVVTVCQDFNFFYDETGIVTKNTGGYLGITVTFDEERKFVNGSVQTCFSFEPDDLISINVPNNLFEME
jgi:hypothetical protein